MVKDPKKWPTRAGRLDAVSVTNVRRSKSGKDSRGCAVTAIAVGATLAGAVAAVKGWA